MANKFDKLNELHDLLKTGAITQQEFESLKSEIIKNVNFTSNTFTQNIQSNIPDNGNKEKISLKSFHDSEGTLIKAPDIHYLNLKDLSDNEIKLLKPFIRQKQIHSPSEMTSDEIKIGNKIFSVLEIAEMNSERPGFNYALLSIVSLVASGFSLWLATISPCLLIFAGTIITASIFNSIFILLKVDATKLDKIVCYLTLFLNFITIYLIFTWNP